MNEIPHNQEVIDESHLLDHVQLVFQTLLLVRRVAVMAVKPLHTQLVQVLLRRISLGHRVYRQVVFSEFKFYIALIRNDLCVFQHLRMIREQLPHLLLALEVKLLSLKPHAVGIVNAMTGLNAHQDVLQVGILSARIVRIVGEGNRNVQLLRQAEQLGIDILLLTQSVILYLEIEISLAEDLTVFLRTALGAGVVVRHQLARDLARNTAGQRNQSARILAQEVFVHTRPVVESLGEGQADHVDQIAVSLLIFAQQNQMIWIVVLSVHFVETGARRDIDLTADDRLDARPLGRSIEIHHAIHHAVIGDRNRVLSDFFQMVHHTGNPVRTVQQTELRVYMQMGKTHVSSSFFPPDICSAIATMRRSR